MITIKIAIIGLGYVGLPLARLFATKYPVIGFDINENRINELESGVDSTLEVEEGILKKIIFNEKWFYDIARINGSIWQTVIII